MEEEIKICRICHKEKGKYSCPQCGIEFCSTACYKNPEKHLKCSEDFYRRCVQENLPVRTDEDKVKRMKDILRRFHQEEPTPTPVNLEQTESASDSGDEYAEEQDSDDDDPLEARLGTLDLDDAEEVWKVLTPEERAEFHNLVKNTIEKGVDVAAEPWFPGMPKQTKIEEVDDPPDDG